MFGKPSQQDRIERLVGWIARKLEINETELRELMEKEEMEMVDLAKIKAEEDSALAAIKANTATLDGIKTGVTDALDRKDATIADLNQKLKDALASGSDPQALQDIADEADAILAASNNEATVSAALGALPGLQNANPPIGGALALPPVISGIDPTAGAVAGGDKVTLTGAGFLGTTSVTFGGVPGTNLNVANDKLLTVDSPAGANGASPVVVSTPAGLSAPSSFLFA